MCIVFKTRSLCGFNIIDSCVILRCWKHGIKHDIKQTVVKMLLTCYIMLSRVNTMSGIVHNILLQDKL